MLYGGTFFPFYYVVLNLKSLILPGLHNIIIQFNGKHELLISLAGVNFFLSLECQRDELFLEHNYNQHTILVINLLHFLIKLFFMAEIFINLHF